MKTSEIQFGHLFSKQRKIFLIHVNYLQSYIKLKNRKYAQHDLSTIPEGITFTKVERSRAANMQPP